MKDIQQIVDNFLRATERLESLTVQINVMADELEPALRGAGQVKDNSYATRVNPAYFGQGAAVAPPEVRPDTPAGVVATKDGSLLNFEGENYVPQTPQEPAPAATPTTGVAAPGGAPVEGQGAPTTAPTAPAPAAPAAQTPWEAQAAESAATPAPAEAEPAKKPARRTNEELAAEAGVDLAEVKKWKGGGRISKKDIEEFALLKAGANFAAANPLPTGVVANPFGGNVPVPVPSPEQAPTIPPQHAPAAPPAADWAQAAQPAAAPPASPGEVYGDWPTVEGGFDASNPFGG